LHFVLTTFAGFTYLEYNTSNTYFRR